MGKKSKNKKNRQQHQQNQPKAAVQLEATQPPQGGMLATSLIPPAGQVVTPTGKAAGALEGEDHTRRDIIRILTILTISIILLVVLVIVNQKSDVLHRAGNRFAQFMQLQ